MMHRLLLLSAITLLAFVPAAEASCHGCVDAVVEACGDLDTDRCTDRASHLATHYPDHAAEFVAALLEG